ncbi:hypothetical protein [Streptomyces griseosporeus]|uniref:hypothetical protein n=1 Tax=Streptomyces griseosporeus TaxID=1910 RepID=UPI0036F980F3
MSVAAVAVLVGCGGGSGEKSGAPTASTSSAASRAGAAATMDEVRRDVRVAVGAGGFEGLTFVPVDPEVLRRNPCQFLARVETPAVPQASAVAEVTGELKLRGWQVSGPYDSGDGAGFGYSVTRKPWNLSLTAASVTKEEMATQLPLGKKDRASDFTGLMIFGGSPACREPAPSQE